MCSIRGYSNRVRSIFLYYRRCTAPTSCRNGAVFIQPPQGGKVVRLEGTGRRIWELTEYHATTEEIAHNLACEFSGDIDKIVEDMERFLLSLKNLGLVESLSEAPSPEDRLRCRYLWLLKRGLVNLLYPEHELRMRYLENRDSAVDELEEKRYLRDIHYREPDLYETLINAKQSLGMQSIKTYAFSHTMIGLSALDNLERCAEMVFHENIPGDFMEAGVCQGGASIFLRALQVAHGEGNRRLWAADSFIGLPPPESGPDIASGLDLSETRLPSIAFSLEGVRDHFLRYSLLDENVLFLPGWFADTLPTAPIKQLAILRIDADIYASTRDALECLYPRVAAGGFIIVDDYGLLGVCRQAVDEYRSAHGIDEPIQFVNQSVIYWCKGI